MTILLAMFLLVIIVGALFMYKRNKKMAIGLFTIPVSLVLFLFGWWVFEDNYRFVKSTDLSEEFLGEIHLNDSLANYKKLNRTFEFSEGENVYYPIYLESPSLSLGANENDEILSVHSSSAEHETSRKIKVTDSEVLVSQKYGNHFYKGREMGMGAYIVYVDRDSKRYVRFWLESGNVSAIEFKEI